MGTNKIYEIAQCMPSFRDRDIIKKTSPDPWILECLILVLLQNAFPMLSSKQLIHRLYPYNNILGKEGCTAVEGVLSVSQDAKPPVQVFLSFVCDVI